MFYQDQWTKLYHGDAKEVLKRLPEGSVDMCMTSPPYWGQRLYASDGEVWDGQEDCQHEWHEKQHLNKGVQKKMKE